jgi:hypothetical protein
MNLIVLDLEITVLILPIIQLLKLIFSRIRIYWIQVLRHLIFKVW